MASSQNPISVRVTVIAEDPLVRAGLALLLRGESENPRVEVVRELVRAAGSEGIRNCDVVLWDAGADSGRTLETLRLAEETHAAVSAGPAAILLVSDETNAADAAASKLFVSGGGVLLRHADGVTLAAAVRAARTGLFVVDPDLIPFVVSARSEPTDAPTEALTPREVEVLELLTAGLPNKGIAQQLHISEHTVKFHVNAILEKLGAGSRTDAVVRAARLGLVRI